MTAVLKDLQFKTRVSRRKNQIQKSVCYYTTIVQYNVVESVSNRIVFRCELFASSSCGAIDYMMFSVAPNWIYPGNAYDVADCSQTSIEAVDHKRANHNRL